MRGSCSSTPACGRGWFRIARWACRRGFVRALRAEGKNGKTRRRSPRFRPHRYRVAATMKLPFDRRSSMKLELRKVITNARRFAAGKILYIGGKRRSAPAAGPSAGADAFKKSSRREASVPNRRSLSAICGWSCIWPGVLKTRESAWRILFPSEQLASLRRYPPFASTGTSSSRPMPRAVSKTRF